MDFDDDIDGLLDMEADLHEEGGALAIPSLADKRSQDDVATIFGSIPKKIRKNSTDDDQELLELASRAPLSPSQQPKSTSTKAPATNNDTIDPSAPTSSRHHAALPAKKPGAGAPRQQPQSNILNQPQNSKHDDDSHQQSSPFIFPLQEYVPPRRDAIHVHGKYITITSETGTRVYSQLNDDIQQRNRNTTALLGAASSSSSTTTTTSDSQAQDDASPSRFDIASALRRSRGGLLATKVEDLLAAIEKDQFERALVETADGITPRDDNDAAAEHSFPSPSPKKNNDSNDAVPAAVPAKLWVDRYAPSNFMDLLSDEQINRDVVRWLKSWDACVFGTPSRGTARQQSHTGSKNSAKKASTGKGQQLDRAHQQQHEADPLGRPHHKVILLCGPPGLGKTTLAHVVARHCGYRPLEINASDDRAGATLLSRVSDAVQMSSVIGERKPNCIILDEIDGVAGGGEGRGAIAGLMKIIKATGQGESKKSGGGGGGGGGGGYGDNSDDDDDGDENHTGKKPDDQTNNKTAATPPPAKTPKGRSRSKASPQGALLMTSPRSQRTKKASLRLLMRPIICICNDPYAPALRPLRDVAEVFQFRRPSADRLAHRLHLICSAEGVRAEKSTLRMLAERTECDIRACLNTLQFVTKRQKWIRQGDLMTLGLGQKDMTKGAFQVWSDLLQKKKAPTIIGHAAESDSQRHTRLYNMLMDFGEHDLVFRGIHENLPNLRYFDMALQRTAQVLSDLQEVDVLMKHSARTGDFSLFKYLPATVLTMASRVDGPERPRLQWPRGSAAVRRRSAANRAVRHEWLMAMSPLLHSSLGPDAATLDVLPYVPRLMSPSLRPVSRHLYSKEEHAVVDSLIGSLLSLGIRYSMDIEAPGSQHEDGYDQGVFPAPVTPTVHGAGTASGAAGEPPLQFRPAVHRLWSFHGLREKNLEYHTTSSLSMAARQMLVHETEMEAIRRSDAARQAATSMEVECGAQPATAVDGQQQRSRQQQPPLHRVGHVPLDLAQRLREAGVTGRGAASGFKEEKKTTWLDRVRVQQHAKRTDSKGTATSGAASTARLLVLYKYNEGYTNAVKRPVKMKELLI